MLDFNNKKFDKRVSLSGSNAFTLIEIIVVLSIIILLTSITIPFYYAGGKESNLQHSTGILAQLIRKSLEMAVASEEVGPSGAKIIPKGGYGIYLEKIGANYNIYIFADCSGTHIYKAGNDVCGVSPNKFSEKVKSIQLRGGVQIKALLPSSPLNIVFEAPDPLVYVNGSLTTSASVVLSIISNPLNAEIINVNSAGLISR